MPKINAADLKFPAGPLTLTMFRGATSDELDQALTSYAAAAETEARRRYAGEYATASGADLDTLKAFETAWALSLAYATLAGLAAGLPTLATEVNLTAQWVGGASELRRLASERRADADALLPAPTGAAAPSGRRRASGTVDVEASF